MPTHSIASFFISTFIVHIVDPMQSKGDAHDVPDITLKCERLESAVDVLFWFSLRDLKLNEAKLDDKAIAVHAYTTFASHPRMKPALQVDQHAFRESQQ